MTIQKIFNDDVKSKLLSGDFDFGTRPFEPCSQTRVGSDKPIIPRLRQYLKDQYGASGKLGHYRESLMRIFGLPVGTVNTLLSNDPSEEAKIYTLCCTLSAARKDWANLLAHQEKGFISDFPLPVPDDIQYLLPEHGEKNALNQAQVRYFFHALLEGMPAEQQTRYRQLYATQWESHAAPPSQLASGVDVLLARLDQCIEDAFGWFHARIPSTVGRCELPDFSAAMAVEKTRALLLNLLPRNPLVEYDALRAALIKNASIHLAMNQVKGILRSYDAVVQALPPWLENMREIDLAPRESVLDAVAEATGISQTMLPQDLAELGKIVCLMYCSKYKPVDRSGYADFARTHLEPTQIARSAALLVHDWLAKLDVEKSIRGEKNSKRKIFSALSVHYKKHRDEIEHSRYIFPELTAGEISFLTTRYSICHFGMASDASVIEGALAHLRVKRCKHELKVEIYQALLRTDVASMIKFVDDLERNVSWLFMSLRLVGAVHVVVDARCENSVLSLRWSQLS